MKLAHKINLRHIAAVVMTGILLVPALTSCLKDDEENYKEWKRSNETYLSQQENTGNYERISPVWAPGLFILIKYHIRPENHTSLLSPLSNSTVDIKYRGMLMDSTVFDSSYNLTSNGDSIYRCVPNKMIPGFWTALTNMVPGDSVTVIIPAQAGYGVTGSSGIKPYSTLIFDIKMKRIAKYDY